MVLLSKPFTVASLLAVHIGMSIRPDVVAQHMAPQLLALGTTSVTCQKSFRPTFTLLQASQVHMYYSGHLVKGYYKHVKEKLKEKAGERVEESVVENVGESKGDSIGDSIGETVKENMKENVKQSVEESFEECKR